MNTPNNLVQRAFPQGFGIFSNDAFTAIFEEKNIYQMAALYKVALLITQSENAGKNEKEQFSAIISVIRIRVEEMKKDSATFIFADNFTDLIGM